ncbi:MAG: hypothetical protein IKW51_08935 [Bacteroidales bacterium]|nr:hypothetical protein [Bacteroidales bacterium]
MARTSKTKSAAVDVATVDETTVATNSVAAENMNVEKKTVKKTVDVNSLIDSEEIEVISLIPNVSYKDSYTNDLYKWEDVGHIEPMTYETLRNMWRNHKGYFRNMWLKPLDDRVIVKLGLTSTYEKYEFLMDESNYTRKNADKLCESIAATPVGMKYAIINKIKDLVVSGKITDVAVIRSLEKHLGLDLISFLN